MAQTTEAACLLDSGTMYSRRLGCRTAEGIDLFAGVKPGGVSIYLGDSPIFHFDLDGRWQRSFIDGVHYLKGLDAVVRSIDRERGTGGLVLRREVLPFAQGVDLDESIRLVALGLIEDLDSGRLPILGPPAGISAFEPGHFRDFLDRVAAWDPAAWFAHRERYLAAYGPAPFLPPEFPNSLFLQATLGDLGGIAFGRARPSEHYVRDATEFDEHARAVSRLAGRRLAQHRGIFLAGADVLRRPIDEVASRLATIAEVFPPSAPRVDAWDEQPSNLGTVVAFLDDFAPPLPDPRTGDGFETSAWVG